MKPRRQKFQAHKMNDKWRKYFLLGVFTFSENCFYILSMPPPPTHSLPTFSGSIFDEKRVARKLSHPENKKKTLPRKAEEVISKCFSFVFRTHRHSLMCASIGRECCRSVSCLRCGRASGEITFLLSLCVMTSS